MNRFNLDNFISTHVTHRPESMFLQDLQENSARLKSAIQGKSVLVIGGAGSIGSSFIRALLPYEPRTLVVADINENGLAELTRDIRSRGLPVPEDYLSYPMDYSSDVFTKMFRDRGGFDIVANFSAHKHVRSEKDIYSVEALFTNNVFHAADFLDLLSEYPPEAYFCVSTDKAANPVNLMGASKRVMEDMIFSYSDRFPVKTARFANVAFSNGSLPDGYLHRLAKGQPLTAPKDVKRYFVSPEESGQICLMACILGRNREIFFPKLDESQMLSFDTIAEALLKEHGYTPHYCTTEEEAVAISKNLPLGVDSPAESQRERLDDRWESATRAKKVSAKLTDEVSPPKGADEGSFPKLTDEVSYPVHFFTSDTTGEKPYEEFYTDGEPLDLDRFTSLGVITDKPQPEKEKIRTIIGNLQAAFKKPGAAKEDIVTLLTDYLPSFSHIETGKGLDQRM